MPVNNKQLDAIIISDNSLNSLSKTNPLKLHIDGKPASIQLIINLIENKGIVSKSIKGDNMSSWASAPKLNGIFLYYYLTLHKFYVELIDNYYKEKNQLSQYLDHKQTVIIISTTFIFNKKELKKLVDDIRSISPNSKIIAGGPFIYSSYKFLKKSYNPEYESTLAKKDYLFLTVDNEPLIDLYIVSQRGESILIQAMNKLKMNQPIDDIANTAFLKNNCWHFNKRVDEPLNKRIINIDWKKLPNKFFHSGVIPIQSSKGCFNQCFFCNFVQNRHLNWIKPIDQIITELKDVYNRGIRYVWFVDDNFRLGKPDINLLCRRIIDENININWMSFIRADVLKNVDHDLLRRSGCIEVQIGLESADKRILKNMNKKLHPEIYKEIIPKLLLAGINCSCYLIIGFPGETNETISNTVDFIENISPHSAEGSLSWSIFPFILTPLSPIYEPEARINYNLEGYMSKWSHLTMNSDDALNHVLEVFYKIKNSSSIYREDNIDILNNLSPTFRKVILKARHKLSQISFKKKMLTNEIYNYLDKIVSNFSDDFYTTNSKNG